MAAADLARAGDPQPPAGRQLRLGLRRGLRAGLPADGRGARAPSGRPPVAPLHAARCSSGCAPSDRSSSSGCAALVDRGQVEILGGGYYEPVLASLPERDRIGQLRADERRARGAVRAPAARGVAGRTRLGAGPADVAGRRPATTGRSSTTPTSAPRRSREEDLWGPYTTEDQGQLLRVFGTEQGLRYRIPFRDVEEVIDYLRDHATEDGERIGMMGDDGEKFGAWPTTWEHCWGERPLGRPVLRGARGERRLADHDDARPTWLATHPPIGRVYVPTGSYAEMGEWALPPDESLVFTDVLHARAGASTARRRAGCAARSGATSRSSTARSTTSTSRCSGRRTRWTRWRAGRDRERALDHLYQGQSNDCYWHGLFGGHLHQPHAARDLRAPDRGRGPRRRPRPAGSRPPSGATSTSTGSTTSGWPAPGQVVTIDLTEGAGDRRLGHPGRPARPVRGHAPPARGVPRDAARARGQGPGRARRRRDRRDGPASIHEIVLTKEPGLAAKLHYDPYERRSGLVRFLRARHRAAGLGDRRRRRARRRRRGRLRGRLARGRPARRGPRRDGRRARARPAGGPGRPSGSSSAATAGPRPWPRRSRSRTDPRSASMRGLGLEWTLTMLGGGGNRRPGSRWTASATATTRAGRRRGVTRARARATTTSASRSRTTVSEPADVWWAPVETISNSEAGFERVYQGAGCPVQLAAGARRRRVADGRRDPRRDDDP